MKKALGKGLDALFSCERSLMEIDIELIDEPDCPLREASSVDELTESVKERGILQPVLLRPSGGRYQIIAGNRRFLAAKRANLKYIPAQIKNVTNDESICLAIIENIQREDLNPIEQAQAYNYLIENFKYTHQQIADFLHKDRTSVTNTLRLLRLPDKIKQLIKEGKLSEGHARLLIGKDSDIAVELAEQVVARGMSVRELERLCNLKERKKVYSKLPSQFDSLQRTLTSVLGRTVRIKPQKKDKGLIILEYYSLQDFEYLTGQLLHAFGRKES